MPIETHPISSRAQWLELRKRDVTASAIGALLGVHEYLTPFALYGLKTGQLDEDPDETPSMQRGRLLEPVALELYREQRPAVAVTRPNVYLRDPQYRLGATPDAFASDPARGPGIVQIKSVEPSVFRGKWRDDDGDLAPPMWILLQSLVEAHLAGAQWAQVAALVVGHGLDLHVVDVPLHAGAVEQIQKVAAGFWRMLEAGIAPDLDFSRDADAIAKVWRQDSGAEIDLTHDRRFNTLCETKAALTATKSACDRDLKAINAEILAIMKDASSARFARGRVTAKTIHRKEYQVAACSYRSPTVTFDKQQRQEEAA